ncbi:DNA polymerase-3 subunit epsilon [Noviherbaspirillum humi]|uniref:DNA-directed DNA polymerase n=1 Tax=Noviherbaspirillum humi TaxID=1688639 RepID=A0A239FN50_9BURK|nr:3'-5' exonuclease [Noviherbaspirillum humi]SNS58048.1 DNA polymerase-3 subunit epsilon [Noviherbaspirillum humi]
MKAIAVIDFETTGLSPHQGDRATEIGAVLMENGKIVDRYQSLMNAGRHIPPFIEQYTGITNEMVRKAPPAEQVMQEVADFVGDRPLLAHNAAFDKKFWDAELSHVRRVRRQEFACSLLLSRRLYPQAPSHKLGALVNYHGLPVTGVFHRALADAEMTAHLSMRLVEQVRQRYGLRSVPHELLCSIQAASRHKMDRCVEAYFGRTAAQAG